MFTTNYFNKLLLLFSIILLVDGCADESYEDARNFFNTGNVSYSPINCDTNSQNEFVYTVLRDTYLWSDQVQQVDYSNFNSPQELLENLKYKKIDKWSYISYVGDFIAVGISIKYDLLGDLRIKFVYEDSPAKKAGIVRGDKLLSINGMSIENIEKNELWDEIFGEDTIGVEVNLLLENIDGNQKIFTLKKAIIPTKTILFYDIILQNDFKIGYLVFQSFKKESINELNEVFNYFKDQQIGELIIDLRYNRGGKYIAAQHLSSLISGNLIVGKTFIKTSHNNRYKNWDKTLYFQSLKDALSLNRVIILTTEETCSASEVVINSLTPYIDVITIGNTTCGKPFGMHPHYFCDKVLNAVEMTTFNSLDFADYTDGIQPTCNAEDDLKTVFGDINENLLSNSIYYINTNECNSSAYQKSKIVDKNKSFFGIYDAKDGY